MDSKNYSKLFGSFTTEYAYATRLPESFLLDYVTGQIDTTNFFANLFEEYSDFISMLKYIPIDIQKFYESTLTPQSSITIGGETVSGYTNMFYDIVGNSWKTYIKLFEIEINTEHGGNFLDFAPYTRRFIYVPYFETIEIDSNMITFGQKIYGYVSLDIKSGILTLYIENSNGILIDSKSANIGINITLGKTNAEEIARNNFLNALSITGSVIATGVGVYSGNPLVTVGGVIGLTKTVTNTISTNVTRLSGYKGGNGNRTELVVDKTIRYIVETVDSVTYPDRSIKGGVTRDNKVLKNLSGYTEVGDINFNPMGEVIYDNEISEIVDLLKSGVIL